MRQRAPAEPARRSAGAHAAEAAGQHPSKVGQLDEAWDEAKAKGWTVVDMNQDWKKVSAFEP
jgi:hypothetical protein